MTDFQGKALVNEQVNGDFKLVDIQFDPSQLKSDEVIVRFHHSGICHTDFVARERVPAESFPCILGHEGAGVVEHVPEGYKGKFVKGDTVIASFCSCGDCGNCKANQPAVCDLFLPLNLGLHTKELRQVKIPYISSDGQKKHAFIKYFGQSSFSSRMAVTDRSLTKVKDGIPTQLACALACGFQTGFSTVLEKSPAIEARSFGAWEALGASIPESLDRSPKRERSQQTLLVTGLGAVGLGAIYGGKLLGYGSIIACDLSAARLEIAKEAGATHILNATGLDVEAFATKVKELSADKRGASLGVEASGSPKALKNVTSSLCVGGKSIILGTPPQEAVLDVAYGNMLAQAWTLEGVLMGNSIPEITIPFLVEKLGSGDLDFLQKIVQVYRPEEMANAVEDAISGRVIKPVIAWT